MSDWCRRWCSAKSCWRANCCFIPDICTGWKWHDRVQRHGWAMLAVRPAASVTVSRCRGLHQFCCGRTSLCLTVERFQFVAKLGVRSCADFTELIERKKGSTQYVCDWLAVHTCSRRCICDTILCMECLYANAGVLLEALCLYRQYASTVYTVMRCTTHVWLCCYCCIVSACSSSVKHLLECMYMSNCSSQCKLKTLPFLPRR